MPDEGRERWMREQLELVGFSEKERSWLMLHEPIFSRRCMHNKPHEGCLYYQQYALSMKPCPGCATEITILVPNQGGSPC